MSPQPPDYPAGAASLISPPPAEGVPVIDLTRFLENVGGTVLNLRAQATILRKAADRLDAEADQLRHLRETLTGETRP